MTAAVHVALGPVSGLKDSCAGGARANRYIVARYTSHVLLESCSSSVSTLQCATRNLFLCTLDCQLHALSMPDSGLQGDQHLIEVPSWSARLAQTSKSHNVHFDQTSEASSAACYALSMPASNKQRDQHLISCSGQSDLKVCEVTRPLCLRSWPPVPCAACASCDPCAPRSAHICAVLLVRVAAMLSVVAQGTDSGAVQGQLDRQS